MAQAKPIGDAGGRGSKSTVPKPQESSESKLCLAGPAGLNIVFTWAGH